MENTSGVQELSSLAFTPVSASTASIRGQNRLFSEVVAKGVQARALEGKVTGYQNGIPYVTFTKNDISELSVRFKHALVATFKTCPPFSTMKSFMQKLGLLGDFNVTILSTRSFLLNFQREEDYVRIFLRRVWRVYGQDMTITKWSPSLSSNVDNPILPIWIAFLDLPIRLHDKQALHLLASSIGHPLQVDSCTLNFSRPQLARCCVEVDISHLPPAKIHVQHVEEDMFLDFYYENVPSYCMDCGKIGHPKERCPLGQNRQDARPKDVKTDTAWQVVTCKKGKAKMVKKPEIVWKEKPYQTSMQLVQWSEGPGESSMVRENSVAADSDVQPLLPQGIFTISDPTLLSAFTMHKLFSPTPLEVKEDCLAIIPYEDCLKELPEDAEPDVGFYMDGGDIDSVCHYLEEFPSLASPSPDLVSSKLSKSSKPRERSHAMDDYLSLHTIIQESQILTCGFKHAASSSSVWISSVYGLHTRFDREDLWLSLRTLFPRSGPWIVGGDFNTVASLSEHKGDVCPDLGGIGDFAQVISECELVAPPFLGSEFTWTGKRGRGRVFRRLDRVLVNESCLDSFPVIEIRHLGQGLSDHRPLLFKSLSHHVVGPKPFRFLNVWCSHTSFKDFVASSWGKSYQGGGMRGLAFKLATLKRALLQWNKEVFRNIFDAVSKAQERLLRAEDTLERDDCEENVVACNLARALLQQAHKKEEMFWSQKANVRWISQGDASTAFFHSLVKGRRNRLFISSLKNTAGCMLSSQEEIAKEAVSHFTRVFSTVHEGDMGEVLSHIPFLLSKQDNDMLGRQPDEEEVWDIIKVDVSKAVQEFFLGIPLPRVFGSTLIILIPKIEGAITLDQFRPISLSTFFSKILSRILSDRLKIVLPTLISPEQAAFQQGKSINEHVLMVKEMVHLLSANTKGGNCIIKLDLSKAFDNISWSYLEQILIKFGFSPRIVQLLMGNLRSTFFSVLVNGQPKGFFPMQCGVKQGDPLSPLLFTLAMEGFTRYFNHLANIGRISCFSSGRTVAPSLLLYADDIVIFTRADCRNLLRLKAALSTFGMTSGQAINFNKSQDGRLGVRDLGHCQRATTMDLWWKVQQGGTIWRTFMHRKYFRDGSFTPKLYDSMSQESAHGQGNNNEHVSVHSEASSFTPPVQNEPVNQQNVGNNPNAGGQPDLVIPTFLANVLQQIANAPMFQPPPPPPPRVITYKTLRDNGAELFLGDRIGEPQIAWDWIEQTARLLKDLNVPLDNYPRLASQLLRNEAYEWWKRTDESVGTPKPWTWTHLDWAFKQEYIPKRFSEEKRKEFVELEQGNMTLLEYRQKFTKLAKFAPTLVSTPTDRIEEFRTKLRPDLRSRVSVLTTVDFAEAQTLTIPLILPQKEKGPSRNLVTHISLKRENLCKLNRWHPLIDPGSESILLANTVEGTTLESVG
ncbi:unnamed protein product [Cuscuta campestris]|uniref:Reverse transcriptase domain-containing protein n=1 Tax=Cuscuta campestris TaxID=132261 RepID=A0A484LA35_9ASTE|nr:unnamed protein product [Cuscuta campestris]